MAAPVRVTDGSSRPEIWRAISAAMRGTVTWTFGRRSHTEQAVRRRCLRVLSWLICRCGRSGALSGRRPTRLLRALRGKSPNSAKRRSPSPVEILGVSPNITVQLEPRPSLLHRVPDATVGATVDAPVATSRCRRPCGSSRCEWSLNAAGCSNVAKVMDDLAE